MSDAVSTPSAMAPMPWWVLPGLALVAALIFAGALAASFAIGDTALRSTMAGAAMALASGAFGFFFHSSMGSQKKDETIAANAVMLAASTPPNRNQP